MKTKLKQVTRTIKQGVTKDSLFTVIAHWCKLGAGQRDHSLQILSAFATGSGVNSITPLLDVFLADGNTVEFIVGVDRNGTDKAALRNLHSLAAAYERQCSVHIFHAPSRESIFHPKLYLLRTRSAVSCIIGSSNLTCGGLSANFESTLLFDEWENRSSVVSSAVSIWETFANPKPPLKNHFLRELSSEYLELLLKRVPDKSQQENKETDASVRALWRPISRLPLPRSTRVRPRTEKARTAKTTAFLLMDILQETRKTQMQIPLSVVEEFYRVKARNPADLAVSIWTQTGISQPINRTLVISHGERNARPMRRLEMPQIHDLARPLAVVFIRLPGRRRFAFHLISRYSKAYDVANRLLEKSGQQRSMKRRFIIGSLTDRRWKSVKMLLP